VASAQEVWDHRADAVVQAVQIELDDAVPFFVADLMDLAP
jgi:hypothetical protein